MTEDSLNKIIQKIPEEELPDGHLNRFIEGLNQSLPIEQQLWKAQRYLIAASIAAMLIGTLFFYLFYDGFVKNSLLLTGCPGEYYETELYFKNQIETKLKILSESKLIDRKAMNDFNKNDIAFKTMQRDLKKNPGDIRLITAVLETYQVKIDFLDEVLKKQDKLENDFIK